MSNWSADIIKYNLVADLGNNVSIHAVLKGYSEENALETACYMPVVSLNMGTKDEFMCNAIMYLTTSGEDISVKEFRDIIYKIRDGKLDCKIEEYSKV